VKLAISNIAWLPDERCEVYDAMVDAGVTGLEIAPSLFFHASEDPFLPSPDEARTAFAEIAARGLTLVSMQSLLFGVARAGLFDGAEARANLVHGMERAIALAGRFGIPNLVFGSPSQRRIPDGLPMNQALDQAVEVFRGLADAAQSVGTKIAIEANPAAYGTNFLNTLDEAMGFVGMVDHPAVVAILDLGAMHMNGDFETASARIPTLLPWLNHVHVSEPNLSLAPHNAEALSPVLDALRKVAYDKSVSIEMRRPSEGVEGVRSALNRLAMAANVMDVWNG
jgi:sugar phosphate isomerase/epimerase